MLTRLKEGTKAKCEPYFPARLDTPMVFEDISITLLSSSKKDGHIRNMLQLKHGESHAFFGVAMGSTHPVFYAPPSHCCASFRVR